MFNSILSYLSSIIAQIIELINIAILAMSPVRNVIIGNDYNHTDRNTEPPTKIPIAFPQFGQDGNMRTKFKLVLDDSTMYIRYEIISYIYTPIIMGYIISLAAKICGINIDNPNNDYIPYILDDTE